MARHPVGDEQTGVLHRIISSKGGKERSEDLEQTWASYQKWIYESSNPNVRLKNKSHHFPLRLTTCKEVLRKKGRKKKKTRKAWEFREGGGSRHKDTVLHTCTVLPLPTQLRGASSTGKVHRGEKEKKREEGKQINNGKGANGGRN